MFLIILFEIRFIQIFQKNREKEFQSLLDSHEDRANEIETDSENMRKHLNSLKTQMNSELLDKSVIEVNYLKIKDENNLAKINIKELNIELNKKIIMNKYVRN